MEKTWKHLETAITFSADRATFSATVNGTRMVAPSLDAIKKKIEAALEVTFTPFKSLSVSGKRETIEVIGLEKQRSKYSGARYRFLCKSGDDWRGEHQTEKVIIDTPENRKIVEHYKKRSKEIEKEKDRLDAELDAMQEALPYVKADDYAAGKRGT